MSSSQASVPVLCAAMRMRYAANALDAASVAAATIAMHTHENTPKRRTPFIRALWFTFRQMPWAGAQTDTSALPYGWPAIRCSTTVTQFSRPEKPEAERNGGDALGVCDETAYHAALGA